MAAPSEEKLICNQFNLEALTVDQVKSFKALADGKDVFIGTKTGSSIFAYISSITCAPCKTSSDWIRVLVAVTNELLKRESSKCILDPPRVERRGTRIVTLGQRRWGTWGYRNIVKFLRFEVQPLSKSADQEFCQTNQLYTSPLGQYVNQCPLSG